MFFLDLVMRDQVRKRTSPVRQDAQGIKLLKRTKARPVKRHSVGAAASVEPRHHFAQAEAGMAPAFTSHGGQLDLVLPTDGVLNERDNIIVLVDEAHRTQEGDLGMKMRAALPNTFLFGFTGTPINKVDRNTFYLSRYGFEESIVMEPHCHFILSHASWNCTSIRRRSTTVTQN